MFYYGSYLNNINFDGEKIPKNTPISNLTDEDSSSNKNMGLACLLINYFLLTIKWSLKLVRLYFFAKY